MSVFLICHPFLDMFHWLQNSKTLRNLSSPNYLLRSRRNADLQAPCLILKPPNDWVLIVPIWPSYNRDCNNLVRWDSLLVAEVNGLFSFRIFQQRHLYSKRRFNHSIRGSLVRRHHTPSHKTAHGHYTHYSEINLLSSMNLFSEPCCFVQGLSGRA
jgi:hypothetical protein